MLNTSWKTTICAVASGLLLAIGACSSADQSEESLAVSQQQEAVSLSNDAGSDFEVAEENNEGIDNALAATLAAVEESEEPEENQSVEEVLDQAEQAAEESVVDTEGQPSEDQLADEAMVAAASEAAVEESSMESVDSNVASKETFNDNAETFTYTVREGDWLSSVSKHIYGDAEMWREVAAENGLNNPNYIVPGQKITFKVTNEKSRMFQEAYTKVSWHEENTQVRAGEEGVYDVVVVKGDSLSKISERVFGTMNAWTKIYEANKEQISNPDLIFVGQKLTFSNNAAVAH